MRRTLAFAPRRWRAVAILALLAVPAVGCVDAEIDVGAGAFPPLPTSSTLVEAEQTLPIGAAGRTPRGNTVAVLDALTKAARVDTLVEACAGASATEEVGVSLSFFALQLSDGSTERPIEPSDAREPALRSGQLRAGTCTLGWLSFELDGEGTSSPRYVVFGSQTAAQRWDLTEKS